MAETTLAYEVTVNDEDPMICGAPELDVLSAMLTAVKERGGADLSVAGLVVEEAPSSLRLLSLPSSIEHLPSNNK